MTRSRMITIPICMMTIILSACVTKPENDPAYVSPTEYQSFSCKQISAEMRRVSTKIEQMTRTDETNQALGAAVVLFAVAKGYSIYGNQDDRKNVDLKRLRNQYDVLDQTSIRKNCTL